VVRSNPRRQPSSAGRPPGRTWRIKRAAPGGGANPGPLAPAVSGPDADRLTTCTVTALVMILLRDPELSRRPAPPPDAIGGRFESRSVEQESAWPDVSSATAARLRHCPDARRAQRANQTIMCIWVDLHDRPVRNAQQGRRQHCRCRTSLLFGRLKHPSQLRLFLSWSPTTRMDSLALLALLRTRLLSPDPLRGLWSRRPLRRPDSWIHRPCALHRICRPVGAGGLGTTGPTK